MVPHCQDAESVVRWWRTILRAPMLRKLHSILALTAMVGITWQPLPTLAAPDHVVISQVQVTGGPGHTDQDFIELFNPTSASLNLKGYRLVKRTGSGTSDTTIKSWTSGATIPAYGFYLWANTNYKIVTADVTTSQTISNDNSIALRHGAEDTGTIVDAVGWGKASNSLVESHAFPTNPPAATALHRKVAEPGSRQDTGNNAEDFELAAAAPHTSKTTPELTVAVGQAVPKAQSTTPRVQTPTLGTSLPAPVPTQDPKTLPSGSRVTVHGTVAVPPGVFSRTLFFIANPALQVELSPGSWPTLKPGDRVTLSGTISHVTTGTKLTVRTASQFKITGSGEPPAPVVLEPAQVNDTHEAEVITVSGLTTQSSATTFTITKDGANVHGVIKNRDLTWPRVRPGQQVEVTGVVVLASTGVRLWPRHPGDITVTQRTLPTPASAPSPEQAKSQSRGYLFLGLVGVVLGAAYLWEKFKLPSFAAIIKKYLPKVR